MNIFSELKIKHIDQPFIFIPLLIFSLLVGLTAWFFSQTILIVTGFILSFLFISATIWHTYRMGTEEHHHQIESVQALISIQNFIEPRAPIPSLTGWAAHPVLVSTILECVKENDTHTVLELGSGSSTIITSYYLEALGGDRKLISLDHDAVFMEKTRKQVHIHELEHTASVVHAPLTNKNGTTWYDLSNLSLEEGSVDLLVVDGPPLKTCRKARKPALYELKKYLSDRAIVIMDDAFREDERSIAKDWIEDFPDLQLSYKHTRKGIAIFHRD